MVYNLFDDDQTSAESGEHKDGEQVESPFVTLPFEAPSLDESVRRSGLAWSAGIVFFGSTAFMLGLAPTLAASAAKPSIFG